MGVIIKCCHHCVAPKRHPGCHDHCPEYIEQRALYDERKAIEDEKRQIGISCYQQRDAAVRKAMKGKR